ncbi:MAG: glycosyltransferase [Minisyncoccia bacterium]
MKILSIGSDRKLFEEGSAVSERIKEYGNLVDELHIVVLALKSLGLKDKQLTSKVWVYPTNSFSRWFYVYDAVRLSNKIIFSRKFVKGQSMITTQDPFECGWVGLIVKRKWLIPLEAQLHTDPFSPYFYGFKNFIRKNVARKVLRYADGVRVVAENLKAGLTGLSGAAITVLPIYVDKEKIENAEVKFNLHNRYPWRFIILAASRLTREKNLGLTLRVLARVRKKFPGVGLIILGAGPEEGRLRGLARRLGLSGAVEFAGWQEDLTSFYKSANLFIQTSLFEGYGLSLVEAGLSGLPVVTTPVGIAKELINEKEAYIIEPTDTEGFVSAIIDLVENNHKRDYLRIHLRQTLEAKLLGKEEYLSKIKETWEQTAKKIVAKK